MLCRRRGDARSQRCWPWHGALTLRYLLSGKLLGVDLRLGRRRIAIARNLTRREEPIQALHRFAIQLDPDSPHVLIEMRHATRPRDGYDVRGTIQKPRQRQLSRRAADFPRQTNKLFQDRSILYEVFTLETRHAFADVSGAEVAQRQGIREPAAGERAEGNESST